jgi:uncharacterized membrane protein YdjX (TVP38/TMEM64 family)
MRRLLRSLLVVTAVLLVPVVPFVCLAGPIEQWLARWTEHPPNLFVTAALVVGLLSVDVVLPVPSSLISTLAGSQLGTIGGTLASWLGMSIGAGVGFGVARRWGRPVARRLASDEDLQRLDDLTRQYGAAVLVVARAVPLLAEASVLLVGLHRLSWRRFWPPVLLSNLGIALAYAFFGEVAARNQWLPVALGVSLGLPILMAAVVRWWLPSPPDASSHDQEEL